MPSSNRICKYYARGTCLKGDQCSYSHERKDASANICSFYQKGYCAYGSRCRYEHVQAPASAPSSSNGPQSMVSLDAVTASSANKGKSCWVPKGTKMLSPFDKHGRSLQYNKNLHSQGNGGGGGDVGESSGTSVSAEHLFCEFDAANCPSGDKCSGIHLQKCLYCRKPCLHPTDLKQRQNHLKACEETDKALKDSQKIECSVCLERVLLKAKPDQRRFGQLPECDHAFCLSCIRIWRNCVKACGMDCPVCRKQSPIVIPSDIWYGTEEGKQAIIDNYKGNCKLIDCKHFKFGNRCCPFGTSCLYKYTVKPGSLKQKHYGPPPPPRGNNFENLDKYAMLNMLSELDLHSLELYSIMKDMEWFDDMDAFEIMALAKAMGNDCDDDDDEDMDDFHMPGIGFEDSDDDEFNPVDAAILSMMMHADMDEEYSGDEFDEDDSDEDY